MLLCPVILNRLDNYFDKKQFPMFESELHLLTILVKIYYRLQTLLPRWTDSRAAPSISAGGSEGLP